MAFSTAPLALAIFLAIITGCASLVFYILAIIGACADVFNVPLMVILGTVLLLGAFNLGCTGVLGMYLGKTYMEVKKRPVYIVGETEETYRQRKSASN